MRPADKELTHAVRALRDPRAWGRWGIPGPVAKRAGAIAGAAAHTQGPVLRSRHDPNLVELSLDQVG